MNLQSLLLSTTELLDLPPVELGPDRAFQVDFGEGATANVDVSAWPLIRLYRSLPLPLHGDLARTCRTLLEWNAELQGPALACDEGGTLYLVQPLQGQYLTPEELAGAMTSFGALGSVFQQRLADFDIPARELPSLGEEVTAETALFNPHSFA